MSESLRLYQVDAFSDRLFAGNPAAVCPLDAWLPDEILQGIAADNCVPETAFYAPEPGGGRRIRWFTPTIEVELCGHATLASAFVLVHYDGCSDEPIVFHSKSGPLSVSRGPDHLLVLDFPADRLTPAPAPPEIDRALGRRPTETFRGRSDYLLVFDDEEVVASLEPDFSALAAAPCRGVIVTAPGRDSDFVSRFFAPKIGIPEDPVTGSAHTTLTPYWTERLGRRRLSARQISQRTGRLECELTGDRVRIGGRVTPYLEGRVLLRPEPATRLDSRPALSIPRATP